MKAIIVIDMLKDFVLPTGKLYCGPTIDLIVGPIKERLAAASNEDTIVIFLCDAHAEDDLEFKRFPEHAVDDTEGAEMITGLNTKARTFIIKKTRYSGFYGTDLDLLLPLNDVDEATVVGCCTSICVMDTVGGLANRDIKTIVPKAEVADFDQEMHAMALKRMAALYGTEIV